MTADDIGRDLRRRVNDLDDVAHRSAVETGREVLALRDGLQVPGSRMVLVPTLVGLWAAAQVREEPALSRVAHQGLTALLLGTVAGKAAKRVVCRARPNQGGNPDRWGKADGKHASFPSGHAINMASVATAVAINRGVSPLTVASIGFAAAVNWSSLATGRHWATDLMAGALLDIAAGMVTSAIDGWVEGR